VIKIVKVERKNGKAIRIIVLINNYIESTWIRTVDNRIVEVSRVNYARFLKNLYIQKEEYKKLLKIIHAIFNEDRSKAGRK
jgi:hypothetical protein